MSKCSVLYVQFLVIYHHENCGLANFIFSEFILKQNIQREASVFNHIWPVWILYRKPFYLHYPSICTKKANL